MSFIQEHRREIIRGALCMSSSFPIYIIFAFVLYGLFKSFSHIFFAINIFLCDQSIKQLKNVGREFLKIEANQTQFFKSLILRPAPSQKKDDDEVDWWHPSFQTTDYFSQKITRKGNIGFPSGHASTSGFVFGLSMFLDDRHALFGTTGFIARFFTLSICLFIAGGRYLKRVHTPPQIAVGALIGFVWSWVVSKMANMF